MEDPGAIELIPTFADAGDSGRVLTDIEVSHLEEDGVDEQSPPEDEDDEDEDEEDDGDEDEDDDEDAFVEAEDFKIELRYCLDDVKYDGTFSAFRQLAKYVNPGLHIANYGPVGLPLAFRDAQAIAQVCKQAPFGKGSQTIVDTSVRKTWELDASEFQCRNPQWATEIDAIVSQAVEDLGVQVVSRAELYKLLLYEEGAFFKAHKDSEKVPGMFGTLVVCLPSEHSGGEVHLVHGKEKRVLQTAPGSKFDLSTLAWYSDVQHEIQPITSGYRLVLTYNLVQDKTLPRQAAAVLDESHARLESLLRIWRTNFDCYPDTLVYPLTHKYTEASLCLKNLKGHDAAKGRYLEHICAKNGVIWLLGRMTKEERNDGEDTDISLDHIVTPNGTRISDFLEIDEDGILVDGMYHDRSADSEDEGEYMGNEGMDSTYRYHDTVLILLRRQVFFKEFIRNMRLDDPHSLQTLFNLIRHKDPMSSTEEETITVTIPTVKAILDTVMKQLSKMNNQQNYRPYPNEPYEIRVSRYMLLYRGISEFCDKIGHASLVREALLKAAKTPPLYWSPALVDIIAKQAANDAAQGTPDSWDTWFPKTLGEVSLNHLSDQREKFEKLRSKLPASAITSFDAWVDVYTAGMLQSINSFSEEDIVPLVGLIPSIDSETYNDFILPAIAKCSCRSVIIRLLGILALQASEKPDLWSDTVKTTYKFVIRAAVTTFKVSARDLKDAESTSRHPGAGMLRDYLSRLVGVLRTTLAFGLSDEAVQLATVALPELPAVMDPLWQNWTEMIDYTRRFIDVLEWNRHPTIEAMVAGFIRTTMHNIALSLTRRFPIEPANWARVTMPAHCGCGACRSLRRFIESPTEPVGKFTYADRTRIHLQDKLRPNKDDYRITNDRKTSTLIITKTHNEYHRMKQQWETEVKSMYYYTQRLRSSFVETLLGADYEAVLSLRNVTEGPGPKTAQSALAVALNASSVPPVAGVKRKAMDEIAPNGGTVPPVSVKRQAMDIVDLTGDASD